MLFQLRYRSYAFTVTYLAQLILTHAIPLFWRCCFDASTVLSSQVGRDFQSSSDPGVDRRDSSRRQEATSDAKSLKGGPRTAQFFLEL